LASWVSQVHEPSLAARVVAGHRGKPRFNPDCHPCAAPAFAGLSDSCRRQQTHLTPLAGKDSSPAVNLVWGLGNAVGGLALTRACARTSDRQWDGSLVVFEAGAAAFALWMAVSEAVLRMNTSGGAFGQG